MLRGIHLDQSIVQQSMVNMLTSNAEKERLDGPQLEFFLVRIDEIAIDKGGEHSKCNRD